MEESTRAKIMRLLGWGQTAIHIGFIPAVLLLGYLNADPKPSLLRLISPLAA
ncbi:hypothetical protein SmJEL517_g01458 [Synchytrium microbalum]|uniref:Mitochondrial import receptor subunit TOM7 n=1 Tax=Synchytrium microbalum TaxID=1806994 RepID=A0A507CEN7_9FUNG|nr:uncharacterized protein SmJEL517_g01458 [Synchytrium microbalum]TPX36374.1 hypothetical protein SmJEL517_g01458 [Synchytrium microbalum]